jgi:hypothetical protein
MKKLEAYALHKQVRRKFKRRTTIVSDLDECWHVDLIDMRKIATKNSNIKYLLACVDVLSRYAWVIGLKNKSSKTSKEGFEKIFEGGRIPKYIYSDWGKEFKGECKQYFKSLNIDQLDTKSQNKASIVERFNRTLKNKIARYLTLTNKEKYNDVLDDLVASYNNSYHSTIKTKPIDVTSNNQELVKKTLYGEDIDDVETISDQALIDKNKIHFVFKIGDYVRLINDKNIFDKGYSPSWSREIYIIKQLNPSNPPTYKISSLEGKTYDWNYYKEELQSVPNEQFPYDVFEIINERGKQVTIQQLNSDDKNTFTINKNKIR